MLSRAEALVRKLDPVFEEIIEGHSFGSKENRIERPRAHRFHFIEICGGAGKVTKYFAERMGLWASPRLRLIEALELERSALALLVHQSL